MRHAMQVKRPRISPAVSLIGKIGPETMSRVLSALDQYGAGRWEVSRVGTGRDGDWFAVLYWPTHRYDQGRPWELVFGFDGSVWSD